MELQMQAMGLEMPLVAEHPNRLPFRGVLTLLGTPSKRPPTGARGHRVLLTGKAAEAAIPSLLGMALDYSPEMNGHDVRRKIGIIAQAEMAAITAGGAGAARLEVSGFLYQHDFPEVIAEIRAGKSALGMSYEIANAWIPDVAAEIWTVTKFAFTGAAVLRRDKAAYPETWFKIEQAGAGRSSPKQPDLCRRRE